MSDFKKHDETDERGNEVNLSAVDWDKKIKRIISANTTLNLHFNGS